MSTGVLEFNEASRPRFTLVEEPASNGNSAPPAVALMQIVTGSLAAQAIYVAAKLGIADLLRNGPKSAEALAKETATDAPSLYRVLRALASQGVFVEGGNQIFDLTPTAELLRSDSPNSLRDIAIFFGEDWHWNVWGHTLYSVKTGKAAWAEVHGKQVFEYFAANPEPSKIFDQAMNSLTNLATRAVVGAYDFSGIETLVDVAGGQGRLLTAILDANPSIRGLLFDLPHVLEGAKENNAGLASRCELVSGDFFIGVPENADAYIMKHIIHDWDDDHALRLLTNIKRVMKPNGRVLLVETVITSGSELDFGKLLDIEMLVSPGGKERTAAEYKELFALAGLRLTRIVPTDSIYSVIEAVAA